MRAKKIKRYINYHTSSFRAAIAQKEKRLSISPAKNKIKKIKKTVKHL